MESSPWKLIDKKLKAIEVVAATLNFPLENCGTSLPVSPKTGDIFTLVDSLTAPTYLWTFRYNPASISFYRWEFLGGTCVTIFGTDTKRTLDTLTISLRNDIGDLVYYQAGNIFFLPCAGEYEFSGAVIIETKRKYIRVSTQMILENFSQLSPAWMQPLEVGFNHIPLPWKRLREFNPGKIALGIGSTHPEDTTIRWSTFVVRPIKVR